MNSDTCSSVRESAYSTALAKASSRNTAQVAQTPRLRNQSKGETPPPAWLQPQPSWSAGRRTIMMLEMWKVGFAFGWDVKGAGTISLERWLPGEAFLRTRLAGDPGWRGGEGGPNGVTGVWCFIWWGWRPDWKVDGLDSAEGGRGIGDARGREVPLSALPGAKVSLG